jgi:hypothetical protein
MQRGGIGSFDGVSREAPKGIASFGAYDGRKILPGKAIDIL